MLVRGAGTGAVLTHRCVVVVGIEEPSLKRSSCQRLSSSPRSCVTSLCGVVVATGYTGTAVDEAADCAGWLRAITPAPAIIPRAPAPAAHTRGLHERLHRFMYEGLSSRE
ncbi:MAG: hypothetical protein WCO36_10375 [Actinomycetes bacterium]